MTEPLEAERGAEADTDAIRVEHCGCRCDLCRDKATPMCVECGEPFPCTTVALCDEVDRLRAALASVSAPADRGPGEDAIDNVRAFLSEIVQSNPPNPAAAYELVQTLAATHLRHLSAPPDCP